MRKVYFLSVEKLKEQEVLERLLGRVGEERRKKVLACARLEDRARSLGAGLLLEYGMADCWAADCKAAEYGTPDCRVMEYGAADYGAVNCEVNFSGAMGCGSGTSEAEVRRLEGFEAGSRRLEGFEAGSRWSGGSEAGDCLEEGSEDCLWVPVTLEEIQETSLPSPRLEFRYGPLGKPYLTNFPLFFSLSHSGSYAVCAISDREIGADIQEYRKVNAEGMARRFFTEEEAKRLRRCGTEEERRALFALLWTRKESHGKLTGRGVAELLAGKGDGETFAERRTPDGQAGKRDGGTFAGGGMLDSQAENGAAQCVQYASYGGLPGYEITACWYR